MGLSCFFFAAVVLNQDIPRSVDDYYLKKNQPTATIASLSHWLVSGQLINRESSAWGTDAAETEVSTWHRRLCRVLHYLLATSQLPLMSVTTTIPEVFVGTNAGKLLFAAQKCLWIHWFPKSHFFNAFKMPSDSITKQTAEFLTASQFEETLRIHLCCSRDSTARPASYPDAFSSYTTSQQLKE